MAGTWRVTLFVQAGLLLLAIPASAQVKFGEFSAALNGTVSSGYTATSGNATNSSHNWTVGGVTNLSGAFYSPNFLSYNASLYLNQSRANSNFQSISNASGVNVSSNIFSGSHFPGSLSYSTAYDSEGNYSVPGISNYVTHGNSDTLGINWGENLPNLPSFSAGYQLGTSHYSVYGTSDTGQNSFHSLNLHSGYIYAGFNMGAYYSTGGGHSTIPQVVAGLTNTQTHNDTTGYGFNVTHLLPLHGVASAAINRSTWNTNYLGSGSNGTITTLNALTSVHPGSKFSLTGSLNYSDNLSGQILQAIIAGGGVTTGVDTSQGSNSLDLLGVASYSPIPNLQTSISAERRTQTFLGETYGVESYGTAASYSHKLWNGTLNGAFSLTANVSDNNGEDTLGFSTNENYSTEFRGWNVTSSFGYAQNVQTLLVTYTNSYFNYAGNVRRRWGKFNVSAGAGASRTALTQQAGTANSSQTYNASIGYAPFITANGSYAKSGGQALATGAGLIPIPVPTPVLPAGLVSIFGGDSYSIGLSSTPIKKLILAGAYSKSSSNTSSTYYNSANDNSQYNFLLQYQVRKLNFTSGYSRLEQGFSGTSSKPEVISSYYFGVSRWFNFF